MAPMHSRCYISITIQGNDAVYYYMHLQMFVAYVYKTLHIKIKIKKSKVDLTHDGSSQLQFALTSSRPRPWPTSPTFAMVFGCLLKVPISHFQFYLSPANNT